ncbi:MAG: NADH-quinone oxidoreductase subunit C [Burkholderiaceae bacterium]|nr:MAG: NADH-quinone oxidoreductase subunit C [Burkholderiaceae bacterium]
MLGEGKGSSEKIGLLRDNLENKLSGRILDVATNFGELSITISDKGATESFLLLRDQKEFSFDTLIDLCGVDCSGLKEISEKFEARFCVVYHLLSTTNNHRLRVKLFCASSGTPKTTSVIDVWPSAQWFEREAFDLFGIQFSGNPDLRRILTDYGFVGHPFRKDFPISGHSEVAYDPQEKRVVYQPVTIESREVVPRVVREEGYGTGE